MNKVKGSVRTITHDDETLFRRKDADKVFRGTRWTLCCTYPVSRCNIFKVGRNQYLNECGVLQLILASTTPHGIEVKRWILDNLSREPDDLSDDPDDHVYEEPRFCNDYITMIGHQDYLPMAPALPPRNTPVYSNI